MKTGRISDRVKSLFPDARVYTDHEVAAIIYEGRVIALRREFDKSPIPLFYRGAQNRRLMTREHIEKTFRRLETCQSKAPPPANLNVLNAPAQNSGGLPAHLAGSASEKALKLLTKPGPMNKGSR